MPVKVFRKKQIYEAYLGILRISTYVSLKSRYLSFKSHNIEPRPKLKNSDVLIGGLSTSPDMQYY